MQSVLSGGRGAASAAGLAAMLGAAAWGQPAGLTVLGTADGFQSFGSGVSPDGQYVCGWIQRLPGASAFRWSVMEGMILTGDIPGGGPDASTSQGVSNTGVIAGTGRYGGSSGDNEAFRWTREMGLIPLGDFGTDYISSSTTAINADGSIIVGAGVPPNEQFRAALWTSAGIESLGDFDGGVAHSTAMGISDDGGTVVGFGTNAQGQVAFRWTRAGGLESLGELPGGPYFSTAYDTTDDGAVVIGISRALRNNIGFRWTPAGGMVALGPLPGGRADDTCFPYAVSEDGNVIIGYADSPTGPAAFYWTPEDGKRKLWDVLVERGVNPADDGWTGLIEAHGISADGTVMSGHGTRGEFGLSEAFVAVIPRPCAADFNRDGFLDFFDYDDFAGCFETLVCPPNRSADFNGDGFVDFFDYGDFVAAFQAGC